ncbi:hypothetical protein SUGI_0896370 [Cryptomeria japonica]|nr:hypothetical protein SUGI_0896370 [Cryptomeria japonica]
MLSLPYQLSLPYYTSLIILQMFLHQAILEDSPPPISNPYTYYLGDNSIHANSSASFFSACEAPISYIFIGVASILALLLVGLIVLACSYWKRMTAFPFVRYRNGSYRSESHGGSTKDENEEEGKVMVIMAGHEKPTFMAQATPLHSQDPKILVLS